MCLSNPNLFVISGGPGAGKTTVVQQLASRGFPCASEVARQIIQEQVQANGTALPWRNQKAYTRLMLERSIASFRANTPASRPMFSDRGIPDTLCYARLIGLADEEDILEACRRYRYAPMVFLAPPWKEIYEVDNERKQDFDEAERTFALTTDVYCGLGYHLIPLPRVSPAERARFVLSRLLTGD